MPFALIFIAGGAWMLLRPEVFEEKGPPLLIGITGLVAVLFFGVCLFAIIRTLVKTRPFLVIDSEGIDVTPGKPSPGKIPWNDIEGFSEIGMRAAKLIVIHVKNPKYWIDNERNAVRRRMMKFNLGYCGSPFGISANSARISHAELWELLNDCRERFAKEEMLS
jgi:hypothetical protein